MIRKPKYCDRGMPVCAEVVLVDLIGAHTNDWIYGNDRSPVAACLCI